MHEREKFDNEWAISEIPEPLSNTGGGRGGGGGGVRRLYFVRKLKKGEKFRRENKDWCINLQFFFRENDRKGEGNGDSEIPFHYSLRQELIF